MGRPARVDVAGYAYHVLNRSVGRRRLFRRDEDFLAFDRVLAEAVERAGGAVELLAYLVMPNHWHLAVRTTADGVLGPFMQWLTLTHTQRYRVSRKQVGYGPVYQGRFKSFVIQEGGHLLGVCRYVEGNARRAGLVDRAEQWRWSSLWRWAQGGADEMAMLSPWPLPRGSVASSRGRPRNWLQTVNTPMNAKELEAIQRSAQRCSPLGRPRWQAQMIQAFGLESTLRRPGRPRRGGTSRQCGGVQ